MRYLAHIIQRARNIIEIDLSLIDELAERMFSDLANAHLSFMSRVAEPIIIDVKDVQGNLKKVEIHFGWRSSPEGILKKKSDQLIVGGENSQNYKKDSANKEDEIIVWINPFAKEYEGWPNDRLDVRIWNKKKILQDKDKIIEDIKDVLQHELIHSRQYFVEKSTDNLSEEEYYNNPAEIPTWASNIVRDFKRILGNNKITSNNQFMEILRQTRINEKQRFNKMNDKTKKHFLNLIYIQLKKDGYIG